MKKINWKWLYGFIVSLLFVLLLYSRFVNISWGLPYPFHPDERNMAVALQQLQCPATELRIMNYEFWKECMNPHFFAYGQFPLYLGFILIQIYHFFVRQLGQAITFEEATIALRIISSVSSILMIFIGLKIVELVSSKWVLKRYLSKYFNYQFIFCFLIFIFSPGLIQFAHFGTTESLLMLLYTNTIYISLLFLDKKILNSPLRSRLGRNFEGQAKFIILNSFLCGLAVATKVSSVIFLAVPMGTIILKGLPRRLTPRNDVFVKVLDIARTIITFLVLTSLMAIIFSPHNIISFTDFLNAFHYESDVGLGRYLPFYTRQFFQTTPVFFQMQHIFPYALGWPLFLLFLGGFFGLTWNRQMNILRFSVVAYLIPTALIFTKWTRFMAPLFPLIIVFASLFLLRIISVILSISEGSLANARKPLRQAERFFTLFRMTLVVFLILFVIFPGISYISIYQKPDVRFQASDWMYTNIPQGSYILSETGNVVDIPIQTRNTKLETRNYNIISFDFYNVDENLVLKQELGEHIARADYIIVPSRRIWANHGCDSPPSVIASNQRERGNLIARLLRRFTSRNDERCHVLKEKYPVLNEYYKKLFSGELGFQKVAEFSSYPKLEIGKWKWNMSDEMAEETWTVFDHPVVKIYKRI